MNILEKAIFSSILGDKKIKVIEFLISKCDKQGFVCTKISEICNELNISKPTAIDTIKLLENKKILKRIKNGLYEFKLTDHN